MESVSINTNVINKNVNILNARKQYFYEKTSVFYNGAFNSFNCSILSSFLQKVNNNYNKLSFNIDNVNKYLSDYSKDVEGLEKQFCGNDGFVSSSETNSIINKYKDILLDYNVTDEMPFKIQNAASIIGGSYAVEGVSLGAVSASSANGVSALANEKSWWDDLCDWWNNVAWPSIKAAGEVVLDVLENTAATVVTLFTSLVEGLFQLGEAIIDFLAILGTGILTIGTGIYDGYQAIRGAITGEDWDSATKAMWENTMSVVAENFTSAYFDDYYQNNPIGQWIASNAYWFDSVRAVGSGLGYTAGIVLLTVATFGVGGVAAGGGAVAGSAAGVTAGQLAATATVAGIGKGTQTAWSDGAGLVEGLGYGALSGLWEGVQYYIGGKLISGFGSGAVNQGANALSQKWAQGFGSKALNALTRIILDGVDSSAEGFVQPLLTEIYKDGYYDEAGNYIQFDSSDNFFERYAQLFDDSGGWTNVWTNGAIGLGGSALGELFDLRKLLKDSQADTTTAKLTNDNITEKLFDTNATDKIFDPNATEKLFDTNTTSSTMDTSVDGSIALKNTNSQKIVFKNAEEVALYFGDSKQYMYQRLKTLAEAGDSDCLLKLKEINNDPRFRDLKMGRPSSEIDEAELFEFLNKKNLLTENDKILIETMNKNMVNLTEQEKDAIFIFTAWYGPQMAALNRGTKCIFRGTEIDGTNLAAIQANLDLCIDNYNKRLGKNVPHMDVAKFNDIIDGIISRNVTKQDMVVYRGVNKFFIDGQELGFKDLKPGTIINDQAHVSTSVIPTNISSSCEYMLKINVPEGTPAAYLEQFTGVNNYNQQELLFGRGTSFKVKDYPVKTEWLDKNGKKHTGYILEADLIPATNASKYIPDFSTKGLSMYYANSFNNSKISINMDANDLINKMKERNLMNRYNLEIDDIYKRKLYDVSLMSEHDYTHVKNVVLYSMYMGSELGLDTKDLDLLIDSAKYHDAGVKYTSRNSEHALISSDVAERNLSGKYNKSQLNELMAIIEYHGLEDQKGYDPILDVCKKYGITEDRIEAVHNIGKILKDADALDRTRFPGNFDSNYLRNKNIANDLIGPSYQIREAISEQNVHKIINAGGINSKEVLDLYNSEVYPYIVIDFASKYYKSLGYDSIKECADSIIQFKRFLPKSKIGN